MSVPQCFTTGDGSDGHSLVSAFDSGHVVREKLMQLVGRKIAPGKFVDSRTLLIVTANIAARRSAVCRLICLP